jgi:putative radical SAM enzyme (TIGR03279 family)
LDCYGVVANVYKDSLAAEIGLEIGDKIIEVNGQKLTDIIDLSFAFAEEEIELLVETKDGEREIIEFDKEYDEELGVEFESAVFDGINRCYNKCWFCFVDQIAPNMRQSLSIKDDDYRMSFLYGNFVTLTNMKDEDFIRIKKLHLSPLYISVHTTNGELRANMLHNKSAANIMEHFERLKEADVEFHTQIVLCPGINDGEILEKTLEDLTAFKPTVLSVAIVPVGLTKYRDKCYPLEMFTKEQANDVIDRVAKWQKINRAKGKSNFIYLGDEFYFLADKPIPAYDHYDGFPQLENGIGLTRKFISEWEEADIICNAYQQPIYLNVICGKSAELILQPLINNLDIPNLFIKLVAVENRFFGKDITVTGLLTGQDILHALNELQGNCSGVIIPGVALRSGEDVFLDNYSLNDLKKDLNINVQVANNGIELKNLLLNWLDTNVQTPSQNEVYTWQSNCAYSKNK